MKPAKLFAMVVAVSFAVTLAWSHSLIAQTQQDEVTQLRQKNTELENRVKELETLLKECTEDKNNRFSGDQGYQNKKNWRSLETGMSEEQVKKILGEPLKVIKGVKTLWYYPNLYGGYVSFDNEGRLTGWNEP
jgi:outer membrane protein assembly factor BamE (lipoprotein component of BamABCDE complex)